MGSRKDSGGPGLKLRDAVMLGIVQGPTELLPVSSSGHLVLVPWLANSSYLQLDDETRKSFEVALHFGTAAALTLFLRDEVGSVVKSLDSRRISLTLLSFLPPAVTALTFERHIERYASRPRVVACGMIAGSVAMLAADRSPRRRQRSEATWRDGLALGVGQSCALVPGVSRNGATLVAARLRQFDRPAANELSRHAALPVILGATVLKGVRMAKRGMPKGLAAGFAAGTAASFASSLASARAIKALERRQSLAPYAAYRVAVGVTALAVAKRRAAPSA